jgi:DNA-binding GntR family transcriptional regulator
MERGEEIERLRPAPRPPTTRAGLAAQELRRMIVLGELKAGTRLRQAETAALLGTSTTPVREAFATLSREGLIRHDAHRGAVVTSPTLTDLHENYDILFLLEPRAAELATPRLSGSALEALEAVAEKLDKTPSREIRRRVELNAEFHRRIYDACERPRLIDMIGGLRETLSRYVALAISDSSAELRRLEKIEHGDIVEAIRAGDAPGASAAMELHLRRGVALMTELVGDAEAAPAG